MSLGNKLLNLRKEKGLSQEEVAEKLNVSRQTVSKWETDQSTPDFDKILPLCELYGISSDELLTGKTSDKKSEDDGKVSNVENVRNRAKYIGVSVMLYCLAVAWIMVSIPVFKMNPIVSSAAFILICSVATYLIIYANMVFKTEKARHREEKPRVARIIESILSMITVCIYMYISFATGAWHITWIIWVIFAIVMEIVKLIFCLRGEYYEE